MSDDKDWIIPRNFAGFGYRDVTVKLDQFSVGEFRKSIVYGPDGAMALLSTKGGSPQVTPLTVKPAIVELEINGPFTLTAMEKHLLPVTDTVSYGRVVDGVHFIQSSDRCVFIEITQLKKAVFSNPSAQTVTFNFSSNTVAAVASGAGHVFTENGPRNYSESYACHISSKRLPGGNNIFALYPQRYGYRTGVWAMVRPIAELPLKLSLSTSNAVKTLAPDSNLATNPSWGTAATAGTLFFSGPSSAHRIGTYQSDFTGIASPATTYHYHEYEGFCVRRGTEFIDFITPSKTGFLHAVSDSTVGAFPLSVAALPATNYGETLFNVDKFSEYTGDVCQPFHGYLSGRELYTDETKAAKVSQVTSFSPTVFADFGDGLTKYFNFNEGAVQAVPFYIPFKIGGTVHSANATAYSDAVFIDRHYSPATDGAYRVLTLAEGLYCDNNKITWLVSSSAHVTATYAEAVRRTIVKFFVEGVFQVVPTDNSRFIRKRELCSFIVQEASYFGNYNLELATLFDSYIDGKNATVTLLYVKDTTTTFPNYAKLHAEYRAVGLVVKGTFSGEGRLAEGVVGDGLEASAVQVFKQPVTDINDGRWLWGGTDVLLYTIVHRFGSIVEKFCQIRQENETVYNVVNNYGTEDHKVTIFCEVMDANNSPTRLHPPISLRSVLTFSGAETPSSAEIYSDDVLVYASPNPSTVTKSIVYATLASGTNVGAMAGFAGVPVDVVVCFNKWISTADELNPNAGYFAIEHYEKRQMSLFGEVINDGTYKVINHRTGELRTVTSIGAFV